MIFKGANFPIKYNCDRHIFSSLGSGNTFSIYFLPQHFEKLFQEPQNIRLIITTLDSKQRYSKIRRQKRKKGIYLYHKALQMMYQNRQEYYIKELTLSH